MASTPEATDAQPRRVAVLAAEFDPSLSYEANNWIAALQDMGFYIDVFAVLSAHNTARSSIESSHSKGVRVLHIPVRRYPFAIRRPRAEHLRTLDMPEYELLLAFGTPHFAAPLIEALSSVRRGRVLFASAYATPIGAASRSSLAGFLAFANRIWFKRVHVPAFARAARASDLLVALTPETATLLRQAVPDVPMLVSSLHVDTNRFTYRPREAQAYRSDLNISSSCSVAAVIGRPGRQKRPHVRKLMRIITTRAGTEGVQVLVVGYPREYVENSGTNLDLCVFVPFADRETLPTILSASDLVLFATPSIGIQQALSTGAVVVAPSHPTLLHLTAREHLAVELFNPSTPGSVESALSRALERVRTSSVESRAHRASEAAKVTSVEGAARKLLSQLRSLATPSDELT